MDPQIATIDPDLIEREAELGALDQALAGAIAGRGSVVAIEGPPGIGKSSLVASCLELGRAREMYTISVRATELERSYPYGIVRQTADTVTLGKPDEERAALFTGAAKLALPILDPASAEELDNPELMYQRLHGLYWLIANLSRQQPLLISIDDAQWADEASMAAERFLSLRIADLPMVLLVAARTAEVGQLAVPLAEILPTPQPSRSARGRSRRRAPARASRRCSALATPLSQPPATTPPAATRSCSSSWSPRSAPRASSPPRPARTAWPRSAPTRCGRLCCCASSGCRRRAVRWRARWRSSVSTTWRSGTSPTLAEVPEDDAAEALAELERSGLVTGSPHLRFTHPILRAAIEDDMPAVERSRAHEQAARDARRARGRPRGGGRPPARVRPGQGDWARAALRSAARRAEALGDPSAAVKYLERARGGASRAGELGEILFELGLAAAHAGDPEAGDYLERSAAAGGRRACARSTGRACCTWWPGAQQGGRRAGGRARGRARGGRGGQAAARDADRRRARERHRAPPPRGPLRLHRGAARRAADRLRALRADHARVRVGRGAGRRRPRKRPHPPGARGRGARLLRVRHAGERRAADDGVRAHARRALRRVARDPRRARAGRARLRRLLGGGRLPRGARLDPVPRGECRGRGGRRLGGAADRTRRHAGTRTRADRGIRGRPRGHGARAAVRGARGDRGCPAAGRRPRHRRAGRPRPGARLAEARAGDAQGAADTALALDRADSWGFSSPTLLPWRSVASVALSQLGDEERGLELAREELRLAQELGIPRALGIAQRAVALAGPADERRAGLEAALATLESGAAKLELARVTCELGAELRRSGERSAARDVLRRAHVLAAECGATRMASRARDELSRSGARLIREPASGVEALTPSEVRVAELAAEGLTNREVAQALFVSREDRRDAPGPRVPQARHQVAPRAAGGAGRAPAGACRSGRLALEQRRSHRQRHLRAAVERLLAHPLVRRVRAAAARAEAVDRQRDAAGRHVARVARAAALVADDRAAEALARALEHAAVAARESMPGQARTIVASRRDLRRARRAPPRARDRTRRAGRRAGRTGARRRPAPR